MCASDVRGGGQNRSGLNVGKKTKKQKEYEGKHLFFLL